MAGLIKIDTSSLKKFGERLSNSAARLDVTIPVKLNEIGLVITAEAKMRASEVSKSIPPTIGHHVVGNALTIYSSATGHSKPHQGFHGAAMEDIKNRGFWLHPVFGKAPLVSQKSHPYIRPSIENNLSNLSRAVGDAIVDAFNGVGF